MSHTIHVESLLQRVCHGRRVGGAQRDLPGAVTGEPGQVAEGGAERQVGQDEADQETHPLPHPRGGTGKTFRVAKFVCPRVFDDQKMNEDNQNLRCSCPPDYQIFWGKELSEN